MKQYIITVDGGTTNTRCILWDENRRRIAQENRPVGVRNTAIDGNNRKLKQAVKECLDALVEKNGLDYGDIHRIIASGMITSDVGIVVVPHLTAPAGLEELAAATVAIELPEICPVPIYFIPGIKNSDGPFSFENIEAMDIMRGEEVESIAVMEQFKSGRPLLLVLPGSHNKFVSVDAEGKMTGCLTSISGELLASITNDTIIAKSVGKQFVEEETYDREWLLKGYDNAKRTGLGRTCFTARILQLFYEDAPPKIANFVLGAALQGDVTAVLHSDALKVSPDTTVVVGGKNPLRQAIVDILEHEGYFARIETYVPEEGISLSALGAYLIAEKNGIL